jgi:hypothetical protein
MMVLVQKKFYSQLLRKMLNIGMMNIVLGGASGGQAEYITAGTFQWVCPEGVTSVCVVAIGGGGGGVAYTSGTYSMNGGTGGGLGWKNNIPVIPGNSYTVVVGGGGANANYGSTGGTGGNSYFITTSSVCGYGGIGGKYNTRQVTGGSHTGTGGGNGGGTVMYSSSGYGQAGGGGGGGYSGNGGDGTTKNYTAATANGNGGGGGGGNANSAMNRSYGGGGTGIYGEGSSGIGVIYNGGTGGSDGQDATNLYSGALFGGGGGGSTSGNNTAANGSGGAVRIIWGAGRAFPSTNTIDL